MNEENLKKELDEALVNVPSDLPFHLGVLTTAGHLFAAGYQVSEDSLSDAGFSGRALIFFPLTIENEENESIGSLKMMYEVRANVLLTMQQAADECGVGYRTVQRWRDEKKIPPITVDGKQYFASEIIKDYAARKGHLPGRVVVSGKF